MNTLAKLARKTKDNIHSVADTVRQAFRGKLTVVNSNASVQRAQVSGLAEETLQDIEQLQQFGFTSSPPAGSDVIVLPLGGNTSHGIIVATEHSSYRIKSLASGEVAVYNQSGASIILKNNKIIDIDCEILNIKAPGGMNIDAAAGVQITAPNVDCSAQLTAAGQINGNGGMAVQGGSGATFSGEIRQTSGNYTTSGDVVASGKSLTGHVHTGDSGGTTSPPR